LTGSRREGSIWFMGLAMAGVHAHAGPARLVDSEQLLRVGGAGDAEDTRFVFSPAPVARNGTSG
jgi:hypothetical protein